MNILINTFKENVSDTSKLIHAYLFNHWLLNLHRKDDQPIYGKQILPTQTDIANKVGTSQPNVKKYMEELAEADLLNLYESKEGKRLYTLSLHTNDGELVELNDPTSFDGASKCSAQWNAFGNYISVDDKTMASKQLNSPSKIAYCVFRHCWMNKNSMNEQFQPIAYYSAITKHGFPFTERNLRNCLHNLQANGLIEYTITRYKNYRGFAELRFHTINDMVKEVKSNFEAKVHSEEEFLDKISSLPDASDELKELIAKYRTTAEEHNTTISIQHEMLDVMTERSNEDVADEFLDKNTPKWMDDMFEENKGLKKEIVKQAVYEDGNDYEEQFVHCEEGEEKMSAKEIMDIVKQCITPSATRLALLKLNQKQANFFWKAVRTLPKDKLDPRIVRNLKL